MQALQNRFDVENPLLVVSGPDKMINSPSTQICYRVDLSLKNAGGYGFNSSEQVPVFYNFGSDYLLYDTFADCQGDAGGQTAGSVAIGPRSALTSVFIKRTNVTLNSIPLVFTPTDFSGDQLDVTGSNGSEIGAKFVFEPVGSQELGKCNMVKVRHVNAAGDPIPVQFGLLVKISSSMANFVAMDDANCYSPLNNQEVYFVPGDFESSFYYRGTTASSIVFDANGGIVNGSSSSISVTTPADVDQPYLTWNLPQIKSSLLGSHDFPKTMAITPSSGALVECEKSNQPYSNWAPCDGSNFDSSSNVFTWNAVDSIASSPKGFRLIVSKNDHQAIYEFIPEYLYAKTSDHPFKVVPCDVTLTASGSNGLDDIETALLTNGKVCLGAGTFAGGATATWILGNEDHIIGKTDANGDPTTIIQAAPGAALIAPADNSYLANVSLIGASSGTPAPMVSLAAGSGSFTSTNNIFTTTAYHPKALSQTNANLFLFSLGDRFILDGSSSHRYGIYSGQISSMGAIIGVFNPTFSLTSDTSTYYARAIGVYQSDVAITVENAKLDSILRDGSFIDVDQSGNPNFFASITISNSNLYFSSSSNNLNRFPFFLSEHATLIFNNTVVQSAMSDQNTIRSIQSDNGQLILAFTNSKFVQRSDLDFSFLNTSSFTQNISSNNSQFIRAGSSGSNASVLGLTAGFTWGTNSLSEPRDTRFCGVAGTNWAGVNSGGTITGDILISSALPTITNTADLTNLVCQ